MYTCTMSDRIKLYLWKEREGGREGEREGEREEERKTTERERERERETNIDLEEVHEYPKT